MEMSIQCHWKVGNERCKNMSTSALCSICKVLETGYTAIAYRNLKEILIVYCDVSKADDSRINLNSIVHVVDEIIKLRTSLLSNYAVLHEDIMIRHNLTHIFRSVSLFISALYAKWDKLNYRYSKDCCEESQMVNLYQRLKTISEDEHTKLASDDYSNIRIMCSNAGLWNNLVNLVGVDSNAMLYIYNYVRNLNLAISKIFDNMKLLMGGENYILRINTSRRHAPLNPTDVINMINMTNQFVEPKLAIFWYRIIAKFIKLTNYYHLSASIKVIDGKCVVVIEYLLPKEGKKLYLALTACWLGSHYSYNLANLNTMSHYMF